MDKTADDLKTKGNNLFRDGEYETAIRYYTDAIDLDPANDVLYANRAKSHQMIKNYSESINDAFEAIGLNPDNIKAYLIYGVSICERCKIKKSTSRIPKAIDLIKKGIGLCMKEGKRHYEPRMRQCVRRA